MNLDQRIGLVQRTPRRKRSAVAVVVDADRACLRWQRIRAALCPETGLREPLDEYADRIWLALNTLTGGRS